MDSRTGQIHHLPINTTIEAFAVELAKTDHLHRTAEQIRQDMVILGKEPEAKCKKCHGRGYVKKGLNSKRFKPCPCCAPVKP